MVLVRNHFIILLEEWLISEIKEVKNKSQNFKKITKFTLIKYQIMNTIIKLIYYCCCGILFIAQCSRWIMPRYTFLCSIQIIFAIVLGLF